MDPRRPAARSRRPKPRELYLPLSELNRTRFNSDAGSQYASVRFTDRLVEEGIDASIGAVGDAHDNSLAESINGLYKTELIKPRRPWRDAAHVSAETATFVDWFNNRRLYEYCGGIPPAKLEQVYYCNHPGNEVA